MCIYRIFQMQRKCINIGDLFFFAFAFIVIRCLWSVIQCMSSCVGFVWCSTCKSRNRASESVEYIEFALFVYYVLFYFLLALFSVLHIHILFPCFRFVWCSNTYCCDLNRLFCTAAKCCLIAFMQCAFFLSFYCNCISCCALSEKPDLDTQEYT